MHSITANLKKAHDGRRRAETEIYSSQNPLAKSILKSEIVSQSTSSIPEFSGYKPSSKTSHSNGNENARHNAVKVY